MSRHPAPLPAQLLDGPFTVREARAAGVSPGRLRGPSLRAPTTGVRSAAPPPGVGLASTHARCAELLPALPPSAIFCDVTSLALCGIDLPLDPVARAGLHVLLPPGSAWPRRRGVVGHTGPGGAGADRLRRRGLPVLDPVASWVQLARRLPVRELVVVGDALTRRKQPWTTTAALRRRVAELPCGTRGVRRLREAVDMVRPRTDSPMESRLRWEIVRSGLPCPVVNYLVRGVGGEVVAMPDLAYPRWRIAIEYDGDVHRTDRRTWRRDIARRQALESLGWRVITCTADDVLRTPDRALAWIRSTTRTRRPA